MEDAKAVAFIAFLFIAAGCLIEMRRCSREAFRAIKRAFEAQAEYWDREEEEWKEDGEEEDDGDGWKRGSTATH